MMEKENLAMEMLRELKQNSRRWFIIAIVELVIIIATNVGWLIYQLQYETVTEDTEQYITQEQEETNNSNMSGVIN